MSKKILIIGGVAGGASTAARLRRLDETAEIIIFERGEYISYANCGLPYYIGGSIKERDALLLMTPELMAQRFNVDVRVNNEVISIDRINKTIQVKKGKTGEVYSDHYDTLVISTGSSPLKPPIEGIDSPGIYTLWTIPDTDVIKAFISEKKPKRATVIGGGFIGLEMAENLHDAGCEVTVVEMLNQVMAPIDFEMAQLVHENMRFNNVNLILDDGVSKFTYQDGVNTILLNSGKKVETDLVILAIGVKPNSQLAKDAGLEVNSRGGIVVDDYLKTSDPDIYALGDVIEVEEFVEKGRTMIPLAGPANRQGRICANNINGAMEKYKGTQGTAIAKVFDLSVASTGLNEKTLLNQGKILGQDYQTALIYQKSHAGYYPGATSLVLKMIFGLDGKIFGAQIIGQDGVDKRIDTIAVTMRLGGGVSNLKELELAYAPPYSSAKDPVNMLGFVAENILKGKIDFISWNAFSTMDEKDYIVLDVVEKVERDAFAMPNSIHIPLGQLRSRIGELDKSKLIVTCCAIGVRSYNAARILAQHGFEHVKVYPGGNSLYKSVFHDKLAAEMANDEKGGDNQSEIKDINGGDHQSEVKNINGVGAMNMNNSNRDNQEIKATLRVDCSGLQCPGPIMKVFNTIKELNEGDIIEVSATDLGFAKDIEAWCRRTDNTLLKTEKRNKEIVVYIQKGLTGSNVSVFAHDPTIQSQLPQGKTLVVFSGDLDKVLASFIIANGAASMGRPVTMFFTFWGLNVLRKAENQKVKKPLIDAMFGMMMPRGQGKLTLSKMNMGGMGTAMMKKVMKDKNVDSLQDLIKQAMFNGVKIVACTMSMDIMGITKEEIIDGVEFAGVAAYLGDAEESNVNLFI